MHSNNNNNNNNNKKKKKKKKKKNTTLGNMQPALCKLSVCSFLLQQGMLNMTTTYLVCYSRVFSG